MGDRFDYFVVFAEMRTGSNFLETNLNAFEGFTCHGEAFNPHFIGYPNATHILGVTQADREASPAALIATIRDKTEGAPTQVPFPSAAEVNRGLTPHSRFRLFPRTATP